MSDSPDTPPAHDGVAIIGMSGRFPGARDLDAYWRNLRDGVESVTFFTDEELLEAGADPATLDLPDRVKAGAILDAIDQFDATFFGIAPREADAMDPQQRFFLECSWEALENAGYDPQHCPGTVAVFGGCSMSTYHLQGLARQRDDTEALGSSQVNAGSSTDFLTMRVSYLLDLHGPSITLHTACSTSLVAVVQAWQSLMTYQCDMALAGGVTIRVPQKASYDVEKEAILSADGHCRPFDAGAQGTVSGEGAGVVLLKRLEDAIADGDTVRAVIRGAGINNEGFDKVSIYAPSVGGQAEVIASALALADVDPSTIGYVEAHGTGTALGDPIEVAALTKAYRAHTDKVGYCALGSVKSNFGHAEAGAGVAGLIKTVLALEHREIPPSLNFEQPNPAIDFASSPFFVNAALREWTVEGHPRRAGVSSFGLGGTNAHVVLEEAPAGHAAPAPRKAQLLVLSAKTEPALAQATAQLTEHLRGHPETQLADVAYTLQVGRGLFGHRRAIVCDDVASAVDALEAGDDRTATGHQEAGVHPVAFMFTGQGAQHTDMGRELYETEPVFRAELDRCCELLRPHLGLDLREILYPSPDAAEQASEQLGQTRLTQPALFAVEYALARLWMSWGVRPRAMIGHSIGEYVAATLASVFSLEDALELVAARGRMMQEQPAGDMLSVPMPEEKVTPLLDGDLALAAVNGPSSCVVAGPAEAVSALQARLAERDLPCRMLHTSHAFHSAMMEPIVEPFAELVRQKSLSPAALPCVSTVTGTWIEPGDWAEPEYWARNLRQPVRFADGARALLEDEDLILLEVGPGRTLSTLVRQQGKAAMKRAVLCSMRQAKEAKSDVTKALSTLGRLWMAGAAVDWRAFHGAPRRRVPLPTYPFQRQRHWMKHAVSKSAARAGAAPLQRHADVGDWFWAPSWRRTLGPERSGDRDRSGWLVFEDDAGVGRRLADRLAGKGVVTVRAGAGFAALGGGRYEIDPGTRADYDALLDALRAEGTLPDRIVHAWNVLPPGAAEADLANLDQSQQRGFFSTLFLVQALGERLGEQRAHLCVVTDDLFEVTGREAVHPERATVLGPARVAPQEYENLSCSLVDVQVPGDDRAWDELVDRLIAETAAPSTGAVAAYRGPHRWVPDFEARRLVTPGDPAALATGDGAVLITGGLGGIGLVLASRLAETAGQRLVLVGRSGLPEPGDRDAWLAEHGEDDRQSRRIRAVRALEERGAEVMVARADVADLDAMRAVVKRATQRFGSIRGVIHAAGTATGGMMALRTAEAAAEVLDPKVRGTLVLREVLREQPLQFFALCSALAAVQPAVGAADYGGANAFLDALVHSTDLGAETPFVALGWDAWAEVGMAAETEVSEAMREARARQLAEGIRPDEGAEAFARALRSGLRQVYVSTRDLPARLAAASGTKVSDYTEGGAQLDGELATAAPEAAAESAGGHSRPDLPNPYVAPETDLQRSVAAVVQEILGMDRVGLDDNLFELGFDSLISYMLIGRLKREHGVEPPLRVVLEQPTVAQLAKYVEAAQWAASQMLDRG